MTLTDRAAKALRNRGKATLRIRVAVGDAGASGPVTLKPERG
ncbi:MAG: hypothetical protein U0R24_02995 [Solirubrobacterales bacterium]